MCPALQKLPHHTSRHSSFKVKLGGFVRGVEWVNGWRLTLFVMYVCICVWGLVFSPLYNRYHEGGNLTPTMNKPQLFHQFALVRSWVYIAHLCKTWPSMYGKHSLALTKWCKWCLMTFLSTVPHNKLLWLNPALCMCICMCKTASGRHFIRYGGDCVGPETCKYLIPNL